VIDLELPDLEGDMAGEQDEQSNNDMSLALIEEQAGAAIRREWASSPTRRSRANTGMT
jgi:hypothetical protein